MRQYLLHLLSDLASGVTLLSCIGDFLNFATRNAAFFMDVIKITFTHSTAKVYYTLKVKIAFVKRVLCHALHHL